MACMPRPTTRLQTGRSWTGCSTSVKRQSRAQSRFVRQALRIASTRTKALGGSSPDFATCASSPRAFMDDLERIPVRVKYIGGIVSPIVFQACPRGNISLGPADFCPLEELL